MSPPIPWGSWHDNGTYENNEIEELNTKTASTPSEGNQKLFRMSKISRESRKTTASWNPTPSANRREVNRPFQAVGVDITGPVKYRSAKTEKFYIVLFACSLTRIVYIELLHSPHTAESICCLKRFIAPKGRPRKIFSDNGKTFLAAAKRQKVVRSDEKLQNYPGCMKIPRKVCRDNSLLVQFIA